MRPSIKRGDREGEGHREADIAGIEEGRMEGERGVLQHRVQPLPVERRGHQPRERIGRGDDEEQKGRADRALHGEHIRLELARQIGAEGRHRRAEQGEDQHPQNHRAFMVPPHARDLVEQRLRRMRIAPDILDREVGGDVGRHQRDEGDRHQDELHLRGGSGDGGKLRIAEARAEQRQQRLHDGDAKREDQRVMPGLSNHLPFRSRNLSSPCRPRPPPRHTPSAFSFLATSGGM